MAQKNRSGRSRNDSSSAAVGIVAFLLGFLFAFIVLLGSIFGVAYVAVTTDINEVLGLFGLENKNSEYDENDPDSEKYNYINADQAKNIYQLITEITKMANDGLGEINLNRIDALAPITDTVLDMGYDFIDEVVDLDKEYFEDVPLTSIIDVVRNSMYYVRTGKVIKTLNEKMGTSINIEDVPIAEYMVDGLEANYATVVGKDESFRLPVLFDYYVNDGSEIGYNRTVADSAGVSAYPDNFNGDDSFIHETTLKDSDGNKLYRVYYVPCKVTLTGIEEAEYKVKEEVVEDPNVTFTKNGNVRKLKYRFRTVEYGKDTDFIAVKCQIVDGVETFVLDHSEIYANYNPNFQDASDRYLGYSYYERYAREYYTKPAAREENDLIYGVSTTNHINYFKNVAGEVIEYDPLLVSDLMLDTLGTLNHVPVASVVDADQAETVRGIFGDTSLGDVLNQKVDFNELVDEIKLSTFLDNVRADDEVTSYLVYNVTDVKEEGGKYTAIYDKDGQNIKVDLEVENGIIKSVTNQENGEEISATMIKEVSDRLDSIDDVLAITDFIDVDPTDAIMSYMGYGIYGIKAEEGTQGGKAYKYVGSYDLNGTKVPAYIQTEEADGKIKVVSVWHAEGSISGTKINGVSDRISALQDQLTIGELVEVSESSPMILKALQDTTINGLENRINELKVGDVVSEDQITNNSVLPQLRDTLIVNLGDAIDDVLIQRIYADSIYGVDKNSDPTEVTTFNPQYLYYEKDADGSFVPTKVNCPTDKNDPEYDNQLGKLTQTDWDNRGSKKYYSYGEATGMWKLVLYRVDGSTKTEKAYTLNNFNNMVNACKETVYKSTLSELNEAEVITVEAEKLQKPVRVVDTSTTPPTLGFVKIENGGIGFTTDDKAATNMGDLTLEQFINAIIQFS